MSDLAETIERVVRDVLARMGHAAANPSPPPDPEAKTAAPVAASEDGLVLNRRVVTLVDLPERVQAVRRLVVPCGAVVTPAVRDLLQEHRIALVFGQSSQATGRTIRAVLAVAASRYDSEPLENALRREGYEVATQRYDCLIRAIDQVADEVQSVAAMAMVITEHPAPAICLANRRAGLRAVLAARPDRVAPETESVGANVLVVDPTAAGFFAIRQMALQFLRVGPRPCPEVFQKRLA